jgi:hypothetical protein
MTAGHEVEARVIATLMSQRREVVYEILRDQSTAEVSDWFNYKKGHTKDGPHFLQSLVRMFTEPLVIGPVVHEAQIALDTVIAKQASHEVLNWHQISVLKQPSLPRECEVREVNKQSVQLPLFLGLMKAVVVLKIRVLDSVKDALHVFVIGEVGKKFCYQRRSGLFVCSPCLDNVQNQPNRSEYSADCWHKCQRYLEPSW